QAEDGIRDFHVTGVQTCALPIYEVAKILGEAIGKPELKWIAIPDEQMLNNLLKAGMSSQAANGLVEMNASRINGVLYEDYNQNKPILGKVKLTDFTKDFAQVFNQK